MSTCIDTLIILLSSILLFPTEQYTTTHITGFLILFALFCFIFVARSQKLHLLLGMFAGIIALLLPELTLFLPLICYVYFYNRTYGIPLFYLIPLLQYFMTDSNGNPVLLFVFLLSFYLSYQTRQRDTLYTAIHTFRDDSVEKELILKDKNRRLLENQDNQIYIATLQERNRIAREIHDNVGHMLSRSILQVGALLAICKDETLQPHLITLKETLDTAMNSIRNSVHDLHDESVDLSHALHNLTEHFTFCEVTLVCDTTKHIPKDVKYCFLAIVKEGLNNTMKHSNATKVTVTVKEHPGFYQLLMEDNGTSSADKSMDSSGIGLSNMQERVTALHGILHISTEKGFRIFISIPKA